MILKHNFKVPCINKYHILVECVFQFIEKHNKPLSEFSEEVVVATQQAFGKMLQWYKVKIL